MLDSAFTEPSPAQPPASRSSVIQWILPLFAAGTLALLLVYPFAFEGRHWNGIFNSAHSPAFFSFFLIIAGLLDPRSIGFARATRVPVPLNRRRRFLLLLTLFIGGVACEIAQAFVHRQSSLSDVAANTTGLVAAFLYCEVHKTPQRARQVTLAILVTALLLCQCISPAIELVECYRQKQEFPLLASFERPAELSAWLAHGAEATLDQTWATHGKNSMRLKLLKHKYPGSIMIWPTPDWTGYSNLKLDLYNPGPTKIVVAIHIRDLAHEDMKFAANDRFRTRVTLAPGKAITARIELKSVEAAPATRKMQMDKIVGINLFEIAPQEHSIFHVDNIRLTP